MSEIKLSDSVMSKLGAAVEQWCEEVLPGRPAILGYAVFSSLEQELTKKQQEIESKFPL